MGGFADGGWGPPMLDPPEMKIYADGRIVFADKEGYSEVLGVTLEDLRLSSN